MSSAVRIDIVDAPAHTGARLGGWVPGALLALLTAVVLRYYGVSLPTTAAFAAYVGLGVVLPGTLVWRACRSGAGRDGGWFVADVAAGAALGYALETLTYIAVRAAGAPLLVLAFPVATIAVFLAVPGLRRHWRVGGTERTPLWFAWPQSALLLLLLFRSTRLFNSHLVEWPYVTVGDPDPSFHLAIIGDAKHHMPPVTPWVAGEPMLYHWFVYAEVAATSWVSGIAPIVLLHRLSVLPMIVTYVLLIAVIARHLTGRWWAATAAPAATFLVLMPNPYSWRLPDSWYGFSTFDDGSVFNMVSWTSPTQTFGMTLFALAVLLLLDLLREDRLREDRSWRAEMPRWVLFGLLLVTLVGAKATFLPLLLGALLLVLVGHLVATRTLLRPAAVAAGLSLATFASGQFVLYRGATLGLTVDPFAEERIFSAVAFVGSGYSGLTAPWQHVALGAAVHLGGFLLIWGGVLALVVRRRWLQPPTLLLLSLGAVGTTLFLMLSHVGGAQGYFISSVRPYLTLAAVVGLVTLLDGVRTRWQLPAAAGAGIATIYALRQFGQDRFPTPQFGYRHLGWVLTWPYLALAVITAALVAGAWRIGLRRPDRRALAFGLVIACCAGFGVPTTADLTVVMVDANRQHGWRRPPDSGFLYPDDPTGAGAMYTRDEVAAGTWLRDHSDADGLVATNTHCLRDPAPGTGAPCDNRHFSIAALTERRMLVEGWGYVSSTYREAERSGQALWFAPFWDPEMLAANDAAFATPSADTIGTLRDRYGVTWLIVDETAGKVGADLDAFVTLRYRSGSVSIYEINR